MFLIYIIIGTCLGIITGLTPGVHINLISVIILTLSPKLLQYTEPINLTIIIISMAITHTFLDFIPSTFLGAPEEDTSLTTLPAHSLLLEGHGYEAVKLSTIGTILGIIITIALTPLLIPLVSFIYPLIEKFIPYILILATLVLIYKSNNKIDSTIVFILSGVLGLIVLNSNINQPLFPLLSGLFGTSMLIQSLKDNTKIPKQNTDSEPISKIEITKSMICASIASCLSGFLPGLGPSQAAIIATSLTKTTQRSFILLTGAINAIIMMLSIIALYTIDKARNGAILVIQQIIDPITLNILITFLAVSLITTTFATFLTIYITKEFSKIINKINYPLTCILILFLITQLVTIISGPAGLGILIIATFVGLIPPLQNIQRNHLMGCLILPVILFFIL